MRNPIVRAPCGPVEGIWRGGSAAFLGIPFADAPIGPLAYAAPQRRARWSGVRLAHHHGPTPQRRPLSEQTTIPEPSIAGEDILNLNVFTPAPGDADARLPVLVWVHGGGFIAGSPASPWYDGGSFNRDGIVTVSVSYRLGFEGFGWIARRPSNRGLLDVLCALEWVHDNISSFGGSPDTVTLAGQSAGGGAALALMAAPRTDGLFRSVAVTSPAPSLTRTRDHQIDGLQMASAAGISGTGEEWASIDPEIVLDLQAGQMAVDAPGAPDHPFAATLQRSLRRGRVDLHFGPAEDSDLLPSPMGRAWLRSPRPLLIGTTADEFEDPPLGDPVGHLMTDHMFRRPAADLAAARDEAGHAQTWLYDFREVSSATRTAAHCHDLPYVWDLLTAQGSAEALGHSPSAALAARLHDGWVRFVRDGDPGWPAAGPTARARRFGGGADDVAPLDVTSGPALGNPFNAPVPTC
ncbi:carboxylesterase family protein [Aeromicrobium fastidiosum]|nr:carboxylesterase family protein [Aeromicrobium fastidiosum]MBP2390646.1 para-nitrobenzyl esterase [Aeromicrobium fastidiosum]